MIRRPPISPLFPYTPLSLSLEFRVVRLPGPAGGDQLPGADAADRAADLDDQAGRGVAKRHVLRERSEEHTSELQSHLNLVCRLLLEKKKKPHTSITTTHEPA